MKRLQKLIVLSLASLCLSSCGKRDLKHELGLIEDNSFIYVETIIDSRGPNPNESYDWQPYSLFAVESIEQLNTFINEKYSAIENKVDQSKISESLFQQYFLFIDIVERPQIGDGFLPDGYTIFIGIKIEDNELINYYHFKTFPKNGGRADQVEWFVSLYFVKKSLIDGMSKANAYYINTGLKNNKLIVNDLYKDKNIKYCN